MLAVIFGLYLIIQLIPAIQISLKDGNILVSLGVVLATLVMHFSWGTASLWGYFLSLIGKNNGRKMNGRPNGKFRFERREQTLLLVLGDFVAAMLALGIALLIWARGDTCWDLSIAFLRERIPVWFYFLPLLWMVLWQILMTSVKPVTSN